MLPLRVNVNSPDAGPTSEAAESDAATVTEASGDAAVRRSQFTSAMSRFDTADESNTSRITCTPDVRLTPFFVTVRHVVHDPVLLRVIRPVLSTPSISTWNFPPEPPTATRVSSL